MAVTAGGTTVAAGVYLLAAGTLVLTLFVLAGFVVHARHQVKKQLRGMTPAIKQSGGVLLILVGGYLMILALFYPVFMNVFPVS